jgi:ferredoxin
MTPLVRASRKLMSMLDAAANRLYGSTWNPLYQSGTVAVAMLITLLATGLYLVFVYRISAPSASVARIAADPWLGSWIRSLHRYASDVFIAAALLHLFRMFAQSRSWGPRTLAWISGLTLLGVGFICAWTGFVMAWDSFGERLAREGARLLDVLPVLSEPVSRIFAGDKPTPSAFFFVNLFMHIGLPLAMGVMLLLHVSKLARPMLLPPPRVTWSIVGALTVASIIVPAALGPAADPLRLPASTPVNLFSSWWLPLSERMSPLAAWLSIMTIPVALLIVPRLGRKTREGSLAVSAVDPRLCTGCNQCPQDCPWEAITMVKRTDDRPTLLAQVDASKCVSCGICAGSCAPMGIGPPGRTGRDQLAFIREEFSVVLGRSRRVAAIRCSQSPPRLITMLEARGALVHSVTCAGNLHSSVVERMLRDGAAGVIIYTCPPRDCVNREGVKWIDQRFYHDREAELHARGDRSRIEVVTAAPGTLTGALTSFDAFAARLADRSLARDEGAEEEPVCDTALVEPEP